jgi:hypothetical protein
MIAIRRSNCLDDLWGTRTEATVHEVCGLIALILGSFGSVCCLYLVDSGLVVDSNCCEMIRIFMSQSARKALHFWSVAPDGWRFLNMDVLLGAGSVSGNTLSGCLGHFTHLAR